MKKKRVKKIVIMLLVFSMSLGFMDLLTIFGMDDSVIKSNDLVNNENQKIKEEKEIDNKEETPIRKSTPTDQRWFFFEGDTITGYSDHPDTPKDIVIPESYITDDGEVHQILHIKEEAFLNRFLTSLILNDGLLTIGNSAFKTNRLIPEITIPNSVTSIGAQAFQGCSKLTNINMVSKNLTTIGASAFADCTSLASIVLPPNIKIVEEGLFSGCNSLSSIVIPEGVTAIGSSAFNSTSISSIDIPDSITSIGSAAFSMCLELLTITIPESVTSIERLTFFRCDNLITVELPENIRTIGESAFANCYKLVNIKLPTQLTIISKSLFSTCTSLTSIEIPENVKIIEENAFFECKSLKDVFILGSDVTEIGNNAFGETESTTVMLNLHIDKIIVNGISGSPWGNRSPNIYWKTIPGDTSCFYISNEGVLTGFKPIDHSSDSNHTHDVAQIPDEINGITVKSIGKSAFAGNKRLVKVVLPFTVTNIDDSAFESCAELKTVEFQESLVSIGYRAFSFCSSLREISSFENLVSIGREAFFRCGGLSEVVFGDKITTIGYDAFSTYSKNIKVSLLKKKVNSIEGTPWGTNITNVYWMDEDDSCFYVDDTGSLSGFKPLSHNDTSGHKHNTVEIPESVRGITINKINEKAFYENKEITSLSMPDSITKVGNSVFQSCSSLNNVRLSRNLTELSSNMFNECSSLKYIFIPYGVTKIGDYAFRRTSLTDITIPSSVTSYGSFTFQDTDFATFTMSDNVTSIGQYVFSGCSELSTISLSKKLTSIEAGAFRYCKNLVNPVLPINIEAIWFNAFDGCTSLTKIKLPNSLKEIYREAFANCSSLTSLDLNEGIDYIGDDFINGTSITKITIPSTIGRLDRYALYGIGIEVNMNLSRADASKDLLKYEPWGSKLPVKWLGQFVSAIDNTTYSDNYGHATIHLDIATVTNGNIRTIKMPDGSVKNFTGTTNKTTIKYDVFKNDSYEFVVETDTGEKTSFLIVVDQIKYIDLSAKDFSITTKDAATLTVDSIIEKAKAKAIAIESGDELDVALESPSLNEIKKVLSSGDENIAVTFKASAFIQGETRTETLDIIITSASLFRVRFYDANDVLLDTQEVIKFGKAIPPIPPKINGKTFIEWTPSYENVISDIDVKATYKDIEYLVRYDLNGGKTNSTPQDRKVFWNSSNLELNEQPTKEYYMFKGWMSKGSSNIITSSTTYKSLVKDDSVLEATLVAKYEPALYEVMFDANGGSGTKSSINFSVDEPTINVGVNDNMMKPGSLFTEWNTKADGTGTKVANNADYTPSAFEKMTLYAQWEEQAPSFYLNIPSKMILKNEKDGGYASALDYIKIAPTNEASIPDKKIDISCASTFILSNKDTSDIYEAQVYNEEGIPHNVESKPLMTFDFKNDKTRERAFTVKTGMNNQKYRGSYQGTLNFTISFR